MNEIKFGVKTGKYDVENGMYGNFGGRYVPKVLEEKLEKLEEAFNKLKNDETIRQEYLYYLKNYVGRPSSLYYAKNLSEYVGSKIYLKREDLNHTGSHKINNCIGQILLAKHMSATEIIAETGAGQHGIATATVCAMFGIKCKIFMGAMDAERQKMNVQKMKMLEAEVILTERGTGTLKDAVDAALEYYIMNPEVFYLLGSQVGPAPYPEIVGFFQKVIGQEAKKQILEFEDKLPDTLIACIGGGSNAIGLFSAFLYDKEVEIHAAEGGGDGLILGKTSATLSMGNPTVFQGTYSYCLTDKQNNPIDAKSIAAGLDYPGISPQHSLLKDENRAHYHCVTDKEAIEAFRLLSRLEGIIPAIESSHAIALGLKILKNQNKLAIINLSGRGDKDCERILSV